ncbi:MAG: diacylglycerol/lipid kinase family protein [Acetobacteraceae bacterium]
MLIVFNPAAGNRRVHRLWRVLDILTANGIRCEVARTSAPGDARAFAAAAAAAGTRVVVAAGGDGTIAEVAAGLLGSPTALGVIPLGTANVLALEHDLPRAPRAIAAALAFGRTRPLWPGLARDRAGGARLFTQMLGFGFDAAVVARVGTRLKRVLGRGAYAAQTLRTLFDFEFVPIRLCIDGMATTAAGVIVTKGRLYAGPYRLAPEADPAVPGFSVVLFDRAGPGAVAAYAAALLRGRLPIAPGLRRLRAAGLTLPGNATLPAQADGDPAGSDLVSVSDAPAPLRLVVA